MINLWEDSIDALLNPAWECQGKLIWWKITLRRNIEVTEGQWGERTAIKIYRRNISEEVFIIAQGRERGSLTRTVPVRLERREWVGEHRSSKIDGSVNSLDRDEGEDTVKDILASGCLGDLWYPRFQALSHSSVI